MNDMYKIRVPKITKQMIIFFLMDTRGYDEEEASTYFVIYGTVEYREELIKYYK